MAHESRAVEQGGEADTVRDGVSVRGPGSLAPVSGGREKVSVRRAHPVTVAILAAACSHLEPLSNAYSPFARDLPARRAGLLVADTGPVAVGIAELVAEPERYHQRRVRAEGYVVLQFEGNMLCVETERSPTTACLWLDIEGLRAPGFRRGRAVVEGTFNGENLGHLGVASGAIEGITLLKRLQ